MPVPASVWTEVRRKLDGALDRPQPSRDDSPSPTGPIEEDARDRAIGKLLWSAPLAALALIAMYGLSWSARIALELAVPIATAMLVPCFVHLLECAMNVRFSRLAERWDELKGWQRGLLGSGGVLMAALVVLSLMFAVCMHLSKDLRESDDAAGLEDRRSRQPVRADRPPAAANPSL